MNNIDTMNVVPTDQWDESLADIVVDMNGRPLNVHKLLANNPALLSAWWPLRQYLVTGGSLGRRNAEIVILRTAAHARCWYEWASHVERGLQCELTIDQIESIADCSRAPTRPRSDVLLVTAVDCLSASGRLDTGLITALSKTFDTNAVLDLVAIRSNYVMLGEILNSWPIQLDTHVSDALPGRVTETAFFASLAAT